jgi:hypothetical protein
MLLRFRVANHTSIRDEQEVSLIALDKHDDITTWPVPGLSERALPAVAIFGANASGKSNVIKAMAFMRDVVVNSHQRWLPGDPIARRPFLLDGESVARPSTFIIDFVLDGVRHEYGFSITEQAVEEEWLFDWPNPRRRTLFERTGKKIDYGPAFPGRRAHPVERPRSTSLLVSAGAASEHPVLFSIYKYIRLGLYPALSHTFDQRLSVTMKEFSGPHAETARALLKFADLGIVDIEITDPSDHFDKLLARFESRNFADRLPKVAPTLPAGLPDRLDLEHRAPVSNAASRLPLDQESSGTRTWLGLIGPTLQALRSGTTLIVDELDAHFHPHLAARLIGLFQSESTNPHLVQLIFNTHDVPLMSPSTATRLHRDQVIFAQKNAETGATSLYPLAEFARVRDGLDNIERWYMSGRLGALPVFPESELDKVAESLAG